MYLDKPEMKRFAEIELYYHITARSGLCSTFHDSRIIEFFFHPLIKRGKLKFIDIRHEIGVLSSNERTYKDFIEERIINNDYETVFEWKEGIFFIYMTRQWKYIDEMAKILDKFAFTASDWWNIAYYYMDFETLQTAYPAVSELCRKRLFSYPENELLHLRSPQFDLFLDKK